MLKRNKLPGFGVLGFGIAGFCWVSLDFVGICWVWFPANGIGAVGYHLGDEEA